MMTIRPIGIIHTPFRQSQGTPIQSSAAGGSEGIVEVMPDFAIGLRDLANFERLWLLYLFHRARGEQLTVHPFLDSREHGVFATRSPARPNGIGMSAVRLIGIENNCLRVADVDMLDGTPLLDIKPYVPAFDHFPVSRIGWYEGKSPTGVVADSRFEEEPKEHS